MNQTNAPIRRFDNEHAAVPVPHSLPTLRELEPLMELLTYEDLDFGVFCRAVEKDSVVSNQIMRAARAIGSGLETTIVDLRHALAIIGTRRVGNILETLKLQIEQQEREQQEAREREAGVSDPQPSAVFGDRANLHQAS